VLFRSVKEALSLSTAPARRIHTAVRASYGSYYRRMMPKLLGALDFRSNNGAHRPIIDALARIRAAEGEGRQYFSTAEVPVDGIVRPKWRDIVVEEAPDGSTRINRINYEICVLQTLREKLRCKEVWVAGAHRFRNPDEDLPADFDDRRAACCERLGLPIEATVFTAAVKADMGQALVALDHGMPRNAKVRLDPRRRHPIALTPLEPQPEPPNLEALRSELGRRWPMTGLLELELGQWLHLLRPRRRSRVEPPRRSGGIGCGAASPPGVSRLRQHSDAPARARRAGVAFSDDAGRHPRADPAGVGPCEPLRRL